ncbi:MAG: hypothetical protein CMI02_11270 [Oceanospirillaceae bacterium]|nr:hypothetical protein [Oceanospirillaceae bacterium]MBT12599.1 hypothetical protein [Oceanospirillaceae bacterium]
MFITGAEILADPLRAANIKKPANNACTLTAFRLPDDSDHGFTGFMQLYNHRFTTPGKLRDFADSHQLQARQGLIQIFSGDTSTDRLHSVLAELQQLLPTFTVIGTSTSGEIDGDHLLEQSLLISFSCFEHSQCAVRFSTDTGFQAGKTLGTELRHSNAKLVIAFGNGLDQDPAQFLSGLATSAPQLCVAGGSAADNARYQSTYVITGTDVHTSGIAVAIIYSDVLRVHSHYTMNWTPIGTEMEVTRCAGNVVYELDHQPVINRYAYYLGTEVTRDIPQSINAFPLLTHYDGVMQARDTIGQTQDGGLLYAGSFTPGQKVRFGVADVNNILARAQQLAQQIKSGPPSDAIYMYSCTGRKAFLQEHIADELSVFSDCAPMAGFFTYGEYFHHSGSNRVLNITNTFVTLSESGTLNETAEHFQTALPCHSEPTVLKSLTHLINTTAVELREIQKLSEQYKFALDQAAIVAKCNPQGKVTYINEKYRDISGYDTDAVYGKDLTDLFLDDDDRRSLLDAWQDLNSNSVWRGTLKARSNNARGYFDINCMAFPITNSEGELTELIGIGADITEFLYQQKLIHEQRTDPLTGLPSRARLLEDLKNRDITLLALVDVRSFKSINDYYGIGIGDELICKLAAVLNQLSVREHIVCYRLYSAGFACVPPAGMSIDSLRLHLQEITAYLDKNPITIDDEVIDTELAMGISTGSSHLMAMAEAALQQAKQNREHQQIPVLHSDSHDHLKNQFWLRAVKEALTEQRIICHFQPIRDSKTGQQNYYEALVRLQEKDANIVPPAAFLDIIKKTRYYPLVTREVVLAAIRAVETRDCHVSLNLSAEDISNEKTMAFIHDQLRACGGDKLIFEITETESVRDYAQVRRFIDMAKQFNARISIDDFGSGYSNFSHLVELQPDFIKIDGAIVSAILTDHKSLLVTESIIDLAHKIGARVVAEFVSDEVLENTLTMLGADFLQGYAIGKPQAF